MDSDFQRIDVEGEQHQMTLSQSSSLTPLQREREQRTWVVFCGKIPGIYESLYISSFVSSLSTHSCDSSLGVALQTQGFSDGFQHVYPDHELAEAAWNACTRDGIYPDYSKSPWVVFLG